VVNQKKPDPDPQVSEPSGRDGPAYPLKAASDGTAPATGPQSTPPSSPTPRSLRWHEKRATELLRRFGADPGDDSAQDDGRWPSTWQSFLWDLAPDKVAPRRDGVVLPLWKEPQWLIDLPDDRVQAARTVVRAELDRSLQSVSALELKATRLLTPFVALLTGAVALAIFQVAAIEASVAGMVALAGALFGSAGIGFLLMGMLRALDADTRLGTSVRATLEQEMADNARFALRSDHRGVDAAKFVLRMKGNRILFARAAISRGVAMLLLSSVAGAVALALAPDSNDAQQNSDLVPPTPTPTVTSPPASTTSPTATQTSPADEPSGSAIPTTSATAKSP